MKTCYLIAMLALAFAMNLSPAWAMEVKQDKPFVIPRERIATSVRRIGVMPVSIPANVPHRLAVAQRLEAAIESQLRAGGFEIVPAALMRDIREDLADAIGGMYDAVTGNPVEAKLASLDEYAQNPVRSQQRGRGLAASIGGGAQGGGNGRSGKLGWCSRAGREGG